MSEVLRHRQRPDAALSVRLNQLVHDTGLLFGRAADEDRDAYIRKSNLVGRVIATGASPDATPISHRRIDTLVSEHDMPSPYFLRLDTHGAEKLVLAGAAETLKQASLIQIECYNFKHDPFDKMVGYMRERGFRVIDMCEPLFRDDGAFWQIHLFFARSDHPTFAKNSFKTSKSYAPYPTSTQYDSNVTVSAPFAN